MRNGPSPRQIALSVLVGVILLLGLSVGWMVILWFLVFMSDITTPRRPPDPAEIVTAYIGWLVVQAAIGYCAIKVALSLPGGGSLVSKTMVAVCVVVTVALLVWPMGAWRFLAGP